MADLVLGGGVHLAEGDGATFRLEHGIIAETGRAARRPHQIALDPALEDLINGYIDRSAAGTVVTMPPHVANAVASQILRALESVTAAGHQPGVLTSPQVRAVVRQLLAPHLPNAAVLGYNEVVSGVEVESLALVAPPSAASATTAA